MKISNVWILMLLLIISIGVRLPGLFSRAIWYDEAITMLETAGNAVTTWPKEPVTAIDAKNQFVGSPTLQQIASDLRRTDIHPPVYYWLLSGWRQLFGASLEMARLFSLVASVGSVFTLYLLLQRGKVDYPIVPSMIYAISTGAVYAGHETRAYALTVFFIGLAALFAYLSVETGKKRLIYAVGMAIFGGLAFQTNYLALFPAGFVFLWFFVNQWSKSKLVAIFVPLLGVSIWLIGFASFLPQLSARTGQNVGFLGFGEELSKLLELNLIITWNSAETELKWLFVLLIGFSIIQLYRHWSEINQKLMLLLLGLGFSPSVGLLLLDLLFDKNLPQQRYLILAGPGLIAILVFGANRHMVTRILLVWVIGLQLTAVNWGQEISDGWPGSSLRSAAATVSASETSHIAIVGAGHGRGFPGSVIYELSNDTMVLVVGKGSDLEDVAETVLCYDEIWFFRPQEDKTTHIEDALLTILRASGKFKNEELEQKAVIHLWN
ncbi:MAG: glycosyltransferase family 39 protein [Chloroflexi bacterium]|nr:glycosyltransferase family 39 protein [Chloroflexota bacterium]